MNDRNIGRIDVNMKRVFIDGSAGTTGLRINERLSERSDIEVVVLPDEIRKNADARRDALNSCDAAFLCLPDDAAKEAVAMIENPEVTVIDTSTAHRTLDGWAYGFPELSDEYRMNICSSKRIAVTGCHASGFIALVYPLIEAGVLSKDALLTCFSLTGYSGGGKKMIADYENAERNKRLDAPCQYGLTQTHKHLPEMKKISGLINEPIFCPIVADYYSGMEVTVPLFPEQVSVGIDEIRDIYRGKYNGRVVKYFDTMDEGGQLSANIMSGKDGMQITVCGNKDRILLVSRFDNLGKGASGAAIQCMNLSFGIDETTGLDL